MKTFFTKPLFIKPLFIKPIVIQLLPSPLLLGLLLAVATISSLVLLLIAIDLWIKLTLFLLIILSTGYFIARDALLMLPWSWQSVVVDSKGVLTITNKRQQLVGPSLSAATFVHQYLTVLNVKPAGFKSDFRLVLPPVILLGNRSNQDEVRRLRVWLRLHKNKAD